MVGKSASLLTKTQRNRIRNEFDELTEEKRRRDQQRIRERINSGLSDFQLLADYPDRQFALAFDDKPKDELRSALIDTYIVAERLRELHDIDRAEVVSEARTRAEALSNTTTGVETHSNIDFRTEAEIQRQAETKIEEQLGTGRWDKRADKLAKLGASAFIPLAVIGIADWYVSGNLLRVAAPIWAFLVFLLSVSLIGWLVIVAAQALKYDIVPALLNLVRDPEAAIRGVGAALFSHPKKTVREVWDEL